MNHASADQKHEARLRLLHDLRCASPLSRRRFLRQAAAGLTAATTGPALWADHAPPALKITDLKTTVLRIDSKDWTTLVELQTNQGIVGLGQSPFRAHPKGVSSILDTVLKPIVVGHSPFEYERL